MSFHGAATIADRMWRRIAEYERLTRDVGLTQREACERVGVCRQTGSNYERVVAEQTGETLTQARRRLLGALVEVGLTAEAAACYLDLGAGEL